MKRFKSTLFISTVLTILLIVFFGMIKIREARLERKYPHSPIWVAGTGVKASMDKFNVVGSIKKVNEQDKKIIIIIENTTDNLSKKTGKALEIDLYENAVFENKDNQPINLSDLAVKSKIMASGTLIDGKPRGEKIEVLSR